jgi:5-formyltetrahydrofolate cyclo-ligase
MQTNSLSYSDGEKKRARTEMGYLRADIYNKIEYERLLCEHITMLDEYKNADTILLYFPTKSEPDLTPLLQRAIDSGKSVALPISRPDDITLDFREVNAIEELRRGTYGIYEPNEDSQRAKIGKSTLCIVPALAVDREGYRLGYGKGYYDRFLSLFKGKAVLPIHSSLVCERLPRLDTDIQIKIIVTETGAIRIK